jgi:hypothetical protein
VFTQRRISLFVRHICHTRANGLVAAALIAPPGPLCVERLAVVDPRGLSDSARADLLIARERQSSWVASCMQPTLVAAGVRRERITSGYDLLPQEVIHGVTARDP